MTAAATVTPTTSEAATHCIHQLRFSRGGLLRVLEGFPADKLIALPDFASGGAVANHALWIVGHLATTDDWFLNQMDTNEKTQLSDHWHEIFGGGSKPVADASKYPPFAELQNALQQQRDRLINWFTQRSAKELAAPTPEKWKKYAPTVADFAFFLAWHEGYHAGQLSVVRKALGLAPAFG